MIRSLKSALLNALWKEREKHYSGNVFQRFRDLEPLLQNANGASVLDISSSDGLVSYEFARAGAKLVHGLECNQFSLRFCRYLFREVPLESAFLGVDLSRGIPAVESAGRDILLERYDIVLFLGIYHHLAAQMPPGALSDLVTWFLARCGNVFAARTDDMDSLEKIVLANGFEVISEPPREDNVGRLKIFRRLNPET